MTDIMQIYIGVCVCNLIYLHTGSVPGNEASKCETSEFGGAKNLTWDPEKSFDVDWIWAWISRPTTPTIWGRLDNKAQEMKSWCTGTDGTL